MTCCKSYLESHIRVGQSNLILLNPHFGWLLQFCCLGAWVVAEITRCAMMCCLNQQVSCKTHQVCFLSHQVLLVNPPIFWLVSPPLLSNQTSHIAPCQATHSKGHVHVATVQASTFEVDGIGASEASCPYHGEINGNKIFTGDRGYSNQSIQQISIEIHALPQFIQEVDDLTMTPLCSVSFNQRAAQQHQADQKQNFLNQCIKDHVLHQMQKYLTYLINACLRMHTVSKIQCGILNPSHVWPACSYIMSCTHEHCITMAGQEWDSQFI